MKERLAILLIMFHVHITDIAQLTAKRVRWNPWHVEEDESGMVDVSDFHLSLRGCIHVQHTRLGDLSGTRRVTVNAVDRSHFSHNSLCANGELSLCSIFRFPKRTGSKECQFFFFVQCQYTIPLEKLRPRSFGYTLTDACACSCRHR